MGAYEKVVNKFGWAGMAIGATFLAVAMMIMVANIIIRLFGGLIPGSYEMIGIFVGITVSFSLPFTALQKRHVVVTVFTSRFSKRIQTVFEGIMAAITFVFWGVVAWTTYGVITDRWINETTLDLGIPMLPFRFLWLVGLIIFCCVLLLDVKKSFRREDRS